MLAAILDVDSSAMNRKSALPGYLTFTGVAQQYGDACKSRATYEAYNGVRNLRAAYADEIEGRNTRDPLLLDKCARYVDLDKRNFIPRMLYALLLESRQRRTDTRPADRLQAMRDVLSAPPSLSNCTTYANEYRRGLEDVFATTTKRPDVAGSMASQWFPSFTVPNERWSTLLPDIVQQLADLRDDLRAAGDAAGANECERWLARFCLGIIQSSSDDSTQCLAADLLARTLKDMPEVTKPLRQMIAAHTVNTPNIGTDWAAQMKFDPIAPLTPGSYERALERLLLWGLLVTLAAGAGFAFVFGVFSIVAPTDIASVTPENRPRWWQSALLVVVVAVLVPTIFAVIRADIFGAAQPFYSETFAIAVLQAMPFLSISVILIHAIIRTWPHCDMSKRIRRGWPALLLFLACGMFLAIPAPTTAKFLRAVNYGFPQLWWSAVGMLVFTIFAVLVARVPARYLSRSAASTWLCFAVLACVAMGLHVRADHQYQRDVVQAYRDPMAARVGADWREKYIEPVKNAFNPPIP